jgi:hypothetical protein
VPGIWDSSVGIETGYGLDGWCSIPGGAIDSCILHRIQIGSRTHPVSYPMYTEIYFPGGKAAGA